MRFDELWQSIDEEKGVDSLAQYLSDGGEVDARHPDSSWTLLHLACEHMNHDLVRALFAAGADLNAREDAQGWTPLHHAVDIDIDSVWQTTYSLDGLTFSTTRLLLALGADPGVQDRNGLTPRDVAAEYGPAVVGKFDKLTRGSS